MNWGPWGPHSSTYEACLPFQMCAWYRPTQSRVAAKRKQALHIQIWAPGATYLNIWGIFMAADLGMINAYHIPSQSLVAVLDAKKKQALYFYIKAPGAHILQHMGHIYHGGCRDDQYLSPCQARALWLLWMPRKNRPFIFICRPLGSHTSTYGTYLPLSMWGWSLTITIPSQSQVAVLVAKQKQALYISIQAPGAHILQHMGHIYHRGCRDDQYLPPYKARALWLLWMLRKSRPFIFIHRSLEPTYFNI